ncbi:hypothetical protein [Streptomyces carpaticus]|uniref:hypothetical protein n=1 Tax=Streptomyces carpaticus TaxID=285558 RepID=UPI0031F90B0C
MHRRQLIRTAAASMVLATALFATGGAVAHEATPTATAGWEISLSGDSTIEAVHSVSAVDDDLAWAVGRQDQRGVIMRWDGAEWKEDTAPGLPPVGRWSSVSAASADDVWVHGLSQRDAVLAHYDGESWTTVPIPYPVGDSWLDVPIKAVPGRLFVGGESLQTYADGVWQNFELPDLVNVRGIDAFSADDAYATGMQYPVGGGHPVAYHWDGTNWTRLAEPPARTGTDTATIAVAEPDNVYVGGWATAPHGGPPIPSVLHWDGTEWRDITGSLSHLYLQAITVDGAGGLWVAGMDETDPADSAPVFWHFDGDNWTKEFGAWAPDGDTQWPNYTFWDLAPAGDSGAVWAVGDYSVPWDGTEVSTGRGLIQRSVVPAVTPDRR